MSLLHYDVVTDATSLQASRPGAPSVAAVYVIASNAGTELVHVKSIEVEIPVGDGAGHLTPHPENVSRDFTFHPSATIPVTFAWDGANRVFRLAFSSPKMSLNLDPGDSVVLKLEDMTVAAAGGLALLKVIERSHGQGKGATFESRRVTLGLLKDTPKAPRNFRPDKTMVDVDANEKLTLLWDGPDNIDYWVMSPDAQPVRIPAAAPGTPVAQKPYRFEVQPAPKRGTTYTLLAGTGPGQPNGQGHIFTTTVHARIPEFEKGVRTPWAEGTPAKGRVTFTRQGVDIADESGGPGTVTAGKVSATGVNTEWVQGRNTGDGWISFPQSGVHVYQDGKREWGTVDADRVDLNGVITKWVQGRGDSAGWIEFPSAGLNVFQGAGNRQWGTVAADKADLDNVVTGQALVKGRLDAEGDLHVGGNTVAGGDLTVNGDLRPMRNLDVGGSVTASDLTARGKLTTDDAKFNLVVHGASQFAGLVNADGHLSVSDANGWVMHVTDGLVRIQGDLRVHGESVFKGKVNANALLSVRDENDWIVHANDGQVSIQGDLRVHGALRSDS
ncbi:hypothetical protein [Streptomyces monomycini]|uniref:hypothetical protein n=1 Tax=Streptomyces monomycini TaxID=371720 RepID=UPI0005191E91|nr:hypothetical protein [Streptomyces monomycini]